MRLASAHAADRMTRTFRHASHTTSCWTVSPSRRSQARVVLPLVALVGHRRPGGGPLMIRPLHGEMTLRAAIRGRLVTVSRTW